ncbi:MAG: peroxidase-related enzyme [Crocinitomicaceae bacterium]|nr:peroxidase-related enzyme [Crocinitomicaceae bacterium]
MPKINVIRHNEAEGELKEVYDHLVESRGKLAEVHQIQSLNPPTIMAHMDLYMKIMYGKSPLKRVIREMMAVVVSKGNNCEYCQVHHAEAVNHYWKDDAKIRLFREDYNQIGLSKVETLFCNYAWEHTVNPSSDKEPIFNALRAEGVDDRSILDATLVVAYFNFVNRIVLGLGVELEHEGAAGYNFD